MSPRANEIQDWMVHYLTALLMLERDDIDVTDTFQSYGLDSAAMVGMTGDLSNWLGTEIDPVIAYDYPTIETLSAQVAAQVDLARARDVVQGAGNAVTAQPSA